MSGPVSYASAASSAAKDPKDLETVVPEVTEAAPVEATTETKTEAEDSTPIKEKVSLTPAPLPKVNAWNVGSTPASSSTSVESSPSHGHSDLAAEPPLDPQHWPKPDEGSSPSEKKDTSAAKARPGKWVPLNYTPVTGKPRSKSARKPSSGPAPTGAPKGRSKNFAPKTGAKKTEKPEVKGDKPKSGRTASVSSGSGKEAKKVDGASPSTGSKTKKEGEPHLHHGSHHAHHSHHSHHHNANRNASFNQQFIPYNARRTSGYTPNRFYVPEYNQFGQGFGAGQYEATVNTVVYQLEYYFSVENLCKDLFLRRQMNSAGWIPLTVLADFNRLKVLTGGDYNLFLEATKWAPSVEVAGDKVRTRSNWELWVLPVAERLAGGKDEEVPSVAPAAAPVPVSVPTITPARKLVFNPAQAMPFVPKMNAAPATAST